MSEKDGGEAVILGASEFDGVLQRERALADRGTRRFSLLALERGRAGDLGRLVHAGRLPLRSTDRLGVLDAQRLAILLADTGLEGAHVVSARATRAAEDLGLELGLSILVYPSVAEGAADAVASRAPARTAELDLWPLLAVRTPLWKRSLDVLVSATALLLLSPLFALIALAIRLDSPGPVIFRQQRAGRGGRPFDFYKFRSMCVDAEQRRKSLEEVNEQDGPAFKMRHDPRVTRVGRWLRRWSLDELPQLWNVLLGDLSLVGPRPPTLDELAHYERWQRRRLSVAGGITCIWQVRGRSRVTFPEWIRMDLRYVAQRGFWLDLWLLFLTLPAVLGGRGAY